jgi:hypothetical protein
MSSIVISGDTSGAITVAAPAVAGTNTITMPATTGTMLTTGSPQSGGVIQVVQAVKTDTFSTASTSFVDVTGFTATITPKFSTSKILVCISGSASHAASNYAILLNLVRGSTSIALGDARGSSTQCLWGSSNSSGAGYADPINTMYLDSPATTSATTYKIQMKMESGGTGLIGGTYNSAGVQNASSPTIMTLMEIAA